jgi:hypothetical protein
MTYPVFAAKAGRNLAALAIFFAVLAVAARGGAATGRPPVQDALELAANLIGLALALRLRAGVASVFIAGIALMLAVELTFHLLFSYRAVQSGHTHLAILSAAVLGVALGAFGARRFPVRDRTA